MSMHGCMTACTSTQRMYTQIQNAGVHGNGYMGRCTRRQMAWTHMQSKEPKNKTSSVKSVEVFSLSNSPTLHCLSVVLLWPKTMSTWPGGKKEATMHLHETVDSLCGDSGVVRGVMPGVMPGVCLGVLSWEGLREGSAAGRHTHAEMNQYKIHT